MKQKIPIENAVKEIDAWLERKKIFPSVRDEYQAQIDILSEAISLGYLSLSKDGEFKQQLLFPFKDEQEISHFDYKARINDKLLEPYLKNTKPSDSDARVIAYLACLTSQPKGIIKSLDSADKRIANAIVIFFIS